MVALHFAVRMIRGSIEKMVFPIAGIAMGAATVVAVMGIAKGGRESLLHELNYIGAEKVIVASENLGDRKDVEYLRTLGFVKSAAATDPTFKKEVEDRDITRGIAVDLGEGEDRESMEELIITALNRYNPRAKYALVENRVYGVVERIKMNLHKFTGAVIGMAALLSGLGVAAFMGGVVRNHSPHIGMLKAVGAKSSLVFRIFLIESLILGTAGGVIGVIAGAILGSIAGNLIGVPSHIGGGDLMGTLILMVGMAGVFGSIPAARAADLNPVEAIKR